MEGTTLYVVISIFAKESKNNKTYYNSKIILNERLFYPYRV